MRELEHKKNKIGGRYILTLLCGRLDAHTRCNVDAVVNLLSESLDGKETSEASLENLYKAIETGTASRRLCVTEDGAIWGAAPSNTVPGDQVFVLLGCSVPVVLRWSSDNEYRLVGECYCHGMMDGEALRLGDERSSSVRDIVLR